MSPINLLLSILLSILAIWLIYLIAYPAIVILIRAIFKIGEKFKCKKAIQKLENADKNIAINNYKKALEDLKSSVILAYISSSHYLDFTKEHNQNILSRLFIIADKNNCRLENLGQIEMLFIQRAELNELLYKVEESFRTLQMKKSNLNKEIPKWGINEFNSKIRDIENELKLNSTQITEELEKIFQLLKTINTNKEEIIYH